MFFTRLCLILSRSYFDANDVFGVIEAKGIVTTAIWTIRSSYDSIFPVFMYALYGHPRYSSSAQNINSVTRISILSCLFLWLWLNFYHSSFVKLFCKAHLNRCFWKGKRNLIFLCTHNAQKMKFSVKDFFSQCDQILMKLRIWSHFLKKSLMENFFCSDMVSFIVQKEFEFCITS